MASEKLLKELNDQFNFELLSGYYYMAMAAYCASEDYNGFANFFIVQAQEEYTHAMKFFDLLMTWVEGYNISNGRTKMNTIH